MSGSFLSSLTTLFTISDEQAMWRVKMQDDDDAFARLLERWERPIQNLCTRMTGDVHRAEDLTQETFARVYARRKEYEGTGKFSTYLWRIALNLCHDDFRRRHRWTTTISGDDGNNHLETFASNDPEPSVVLAARENADAVKAALLQLGEAHRTVLVLRHYENLKFREIAEVLDIPEGTVKSRMAEALTQLAGKLTPLLGENPRITESIRESILL
ncbi:MAG: RNA polymerase sigma factor [Opitutaceae bacterium]|nr:RNA polymerase sigma factor [Verrucomicrobiales bacterium]